MQEDELKRILKSVKTIAVVGFSTKAHRPSFFVAKYMQSQGYRILPINPQLDGKPSGLLGEVGYPDLQTAREKTGLEIDLVDVFRRSEYTPLVAKQAVQANAKILWLQEGIMNTEAEAIATKAGLTVVMNRCLKVDHQKLLAGN